MGGKQCGESTAFQRICNDSFSLALWVEAQTRAVHESVKPQSTQKAIFLRIWCLWKINLKLWEANGCFNSHSRQISVRKQRFVIISLGNIYWMLWCFNLWIRALKWKRVSVWHLSLLVSSGLQIDECGTPKKESEKSNQQNWMCLSP